MKFIPYEIEKKLQDKGFNYDSYFAYNDEQIINPEVVEKYGELSDDGYYELTKDYGGTLDFDYVYIYKQIITPKKNIFVERNFLLAHTPSQALEWLRNEKQILVTIMPMETSIGKDELCFGIYKMETNGLYTPLYNSHVDAEPNANYDDVELKAIEYVFDTIL